MKTTTTTTTRTLYMVGNRVFADRSEARGQLGRHRADASGVCDLNETMQQFYGLTGITWSAQARNKAHGC